LADGVSEEILYVVSRLPGLKVIGSTSSFAFRGRDKPRAAKALGASHILDGSVRRTDDRVRVSASLTEAESKTVLWSERYDRDLGDTFALQEEIAAEVAKALAVTLGEAKRVRAPTLTPALSDSYFEARELLRTGAIPCIQASAAALDRVVREAPEFARAWAALASAKLETLRLSRTDRARLAEDAREAAERALGADPSMGEPYAVLAALEGEFFGRWREREELLERALALEPNNAHLHFRHGQFLVSDRSRVAEGYTQQARAFELDPLDPMLAAFHGYNVWSKRSKDDGRAILEEAANRYPDNVFVWFMRLNTHALDGNFAKAEELREDGARLIPGLKDSASYKAGERMQQLMMQPSPEAFMQLGMISRRWPRPSPQPRSILRWRFQCSASPAPALAIFGDALDNVDAWRTGALETTRPHIGYETALLFIGETVQLRMNPEFPQLCTRLGLSRYWRESGRWPDCVSEAPYDFKAACGV
jgi:TolB-like protein